MKTSPKVEVGYLVAVGIALAFCALSASADDKRVAIVYSETSKQNYWDEFAYYQLYMAAQYQSAMAGVPYDLVGEDDLTNAVNLADYDVLVAPLFANVPAAKRSEIVAALNEATANGLNIVAAGAFLAFDENGANHSDSATTLNTLIGVQSANFYGPVVAELRADDIAHPAMSGYQPGQLIRSYDEISTDIWQPGSNANPAATSTLVNYSIGGTIEPAVHAVTTQAGRRNVHFANEQIMQDANVLSTALQWALYGDANPIALRLGRQRSIFVARNDMDQSMFAEEVPLVHVPLLDIITEWKEQHDFVGSYYLNIGNAPSAEEYTNWDVSGPLFQQYRALGSEIGTHSYTHPDDTASLSAAQLEFEFNQSVLALEQNLGTEVPGAAVPGNPESPFVIETVAPWLEYLSGRSAISGTTFGYTSAFGRIRPGFGMFYFCLNTSPDFTLIGFLGMTPAEAGQSWQQEYATHHLNASLPVIHWLWHDYGPTGFEPGFERTPYDTMVATAAAGGSEFVTGDDLRRRVAALRSASLDVTVVDADTMTVQVQSADAGRFALALPDGQSVASVEGWHAWDGNKVLLPKNGGVFTINTGSAPIAATRIARLPPRSELLAVAGDGINLDFSFEGAGDVTVELNEQVPLQVSGADGVEKDGSTLTLSFDTVGPHTVSVFESLGNQPPVAADDSVSTAQDTALSIAGTHLLANDFDPNGDALTIIGVDASGTAGGSIAANADGSYTYTPATGFSGSDSFTYQISDGKGGNASATVSVDVTAALTLTTYHPEAVQVTAGIYDWGTPGSLSTSKQDNPPYDTYDVSADGNAMEWEASTTITDGANAVVSRLTVRYEGEYSLSGVSQQFYLYNYELGRWDEFAGYETGESNDVLIENIANPQQYVSSSGEMRARVRGSLATGGFFSWANYLAWEVETTTGASQPPNAPPTPAFTSACTDLVCDFADQSADADGAVTGWSWDFGDGNSATTQNPSNTYAAAGTYTVSLTVTDNGGATDTVSQSVTATDPPVGNQAPTAAFTEACTDLACNFTDVSSDTDGSVTAWSWDFGESPPGSATSTAQNPNHTYAAAGTYTVSLTVTDDGGATNAVSHGVTVGALMSTTYHPQAINVSAGSYDWGTLASFTNQDDDTYDIASAQATNGGATDWEASTTISTAVEGVRRITVRYEGQYSIHSVSQELYLYNYENGAWELFDTRLVGEGSDAIILVEITVNPQRYVSSSGEMRARVKGSNATTQGFYVWANYLAWAVEGAGN